MNVNAIGLDLSLPNRDRLRNDNAKSRAMIELV